MSVTMQDVAKLAGVSRQAVSAVFNNPENCRIPENTQQKILKAAEECGYVPNAMARSLRGAISHNIGIIGSAPYFGASGSLFRCLVHSLKNVGHDIVYRILDETPSNPQKIAREVEMKGVDGLIVLNSYFDYNCFNVPHVVLNNYEKYDVGCNRKM